MINIKKNNILSLISISLASILQISCAQNINSRKIIVGSSGKIESLDPARANTLKTLQLLSSLGDTLYELDNKGNLIPVLASEMPLISNDKLKIEITLREGVKFHDGTNFDSESMKFTFNRFSEIGTMNYIIDGKINHIETPSKYKIILHLNKPSSSIKGLLTSINLTPISPTFYKNHTERFLNDNFIGTGKYFLKRFTNEVQVLEPNQNYWGEISKNKGINFVGYSNSSSLYGALKSKQIDVLLSNSIDDSQRNKLKILSEKKQLNEGVGPATEISFISLLTNSKPFNNKNVRLALAQTLNREFISEKVSYKLRKPSRSIVPQILKKTNNQEYWPKFNPKVARKLLESEGYCQDKKLEFTLTYRSNVATDKLIALTWQEDLKNNLSDCLNLNLNSVESTTIYKNLSKGIYQSVILDWTGAYSDPSAYLLPLLKCNKFDDRNCIRGESVSSGSFWVSKEVEDLFDKSEKIYGKERLNGLIEIEKLAADSVPYIPIWISSQRAWSQIRISKPVFNGSGRIKLSELKILDE